MPTYNIRTIEKWDKLSAWLKENGFKPWQYQYPWDNPEGFHAWFWKAEKEDVEVVTHNKEVYEAIMKYKRV